MLTLYLLRHAKTRIATAGMQDFDRALTGRGIRDAARMGAWMREQSIRPELTLCSQARRARETLAGIVGALEGACRVEIEEGLYTFDSAILQRRLGKIGKGTASVLLIGHNPALEDLADALAGDGDKQAIEQLHTKFPTCAFAELVFEAADWRDVQADAGHLVRVVLPGDV